MSYRREPPVFEWVHEHFYPQLRQWAGVSRQGVTDVFVDVEIETGDSWPERLEYVLRRSCLLVAIFSPNYFTSRWCRAEFDSMLEREVSLGFRTAEKPEGLIFPVLFNDGDYIPDEYSHIKYADFRSWYYEQPSFRNSTKFMDFEDAVKDLAEALTKHLEEPPEWQDNWPIVRPDARTRRRIPLAKLQ